MRGPVYLNSSDPSELTSKKIYKFISDFSKDTCETPTCDLFCIASWGRDSHIDLVSAVADVGDLATFDGDNVGGEEILDDKTVDVDDMVGESEDDG